MSEADFIYWFNRPKDELLRDLLLPSVGAQVSREQVCSLSLAVALRGVGHVSPNPLVGAVLVDREHRFLAAAAHERVGGRHAEANILETLQKSMPEIDLSGATLYVTLEPCAHEGRTPSCAKAVAASGISRVVFGVIDPNPLVSGRGAAILRSSGVEVIDAAVAASTDPMMREWSLACRDLAAIFIHNISTGRMFTSVKIAASLDNVVAFEGDRRVWITCERAREYGHFLRQQYDAIAVGAGTAISDRPRLNVRHSFLQDAVKVRAPRRVVFDPRGRALSAVLSDMGDTSGVQHPLLEADAAIWLVANSNQNSALNDEAAARGVIVLSISIDEESGYFQWEEVDLKLQNLGIRSLLVEGGPGVYDWIFGCGSPLILPDLSRIHLFQSPQILGNQSSRGARALRWNDGLQRLIPIHKDRVQWMRLDTDFGIEINLTER